MAQRAVMHGDTRCTAIAAASIVAKVTRDRMMLELHARDPRYGFDRHKGYATRGTSRRGRRGSAIPTCTAARSGRRPCLIGWSPERWLGLTPTIPRSWRNPLAIDREDTLKKAEKLLRQGRLEAAIAEYVRVVEEQPRRLEHRQHPRRPVRPRRPARPGGRAVRPHRRAFRRRGLLSEGRARSTRRSSRSARTTKPSQLRLADISQQAGPARRRQGAPERRSLRDGARAATRRGAAEIVVRLGLDRPGRFRGRHGRGAHAGRDGRRRRRAARFRSLYDDLLREGPRPPRRSRRCARRSALNPHDQEGRARSWPGGGRCPAISTARARLSRPRDRRRRSRRC